MSLFANRHLARFLVAHLLRLSALFFGLAVHMMNEAHAGPHRVVDSKLLVYLDVACGENAAYEIVPNQRQILSAHPSDNHLSLFLRFDQPFTIRWHNSLPHYPPSVVQETYFRPYWQSSLAWIPGQVVRAPEIQFNSGKVFYQPVRGPVDFGSSSPILIGTIGKYLPFLVSGDHLRDSPCADKAAGTRTHAGFQIDPIGPLEIEFGIGTCREVYRSTPRRRFDWDYERKEDFVTIRTPEGPVRIALRYSINGFTHAELCGHVVYELNSLH